ENPEDDHKKQQEKKDVLNFSDSTHSGRHHLLKIPWLAKRAWNRRPERSDLVWDNAAMPLVRIDLREGKMPEYRLKIGEMVYRAMRETINVPENDNFQVITEHAPDGLRYDAGYLGVDRTDDVVFIQITLNRGRTLEQKKALYARIAELLHSEAGVRPQDVLINL